MMGKRMRREKYVKTLTRKIHLSIIQIFTSMSIRFSKNSQASSSTQATSGKLEEKPRHILLLLLLVYHWVTELVMREGLARCDSSPQGKTGDMVKEICDEKQVCCVYDVETSFEKTGSMKENSTRLTSGTRAGWRAMVTGRSVTSGGSLSTEP